MPVMLFLVLERGLLCDITGGNTAIGSDTDRGVLKFHRYGCDLFSHRLRPSYKYSCSCAGKKEEGRHRNPSGFEITGQKSIHHKNRLVHIHYVNKSPAEKGLSHIWFSYTQSYSNMCYLLIQLNGRSLWLCR